MTACAQPALGDSRQPAETATGRPPRREVLAVFSLLAAIFILNLITATRFPVVWIDEVMYTDPAANLALGKGFTSTAWYDQASERFWADNVPLHEIVLSGWIRLFGFSATAVRAINYFWFGLGTFLVWLACTRFGWIKNSRLRLVSLVLLAFGSSISFSYRSGRSDMICYFLCAAALCATSIRPAGRRYGLLLGLGFLFPWAGMQVLPLLVIITGLILVFWGWRAAANGIVAGLGAGLGLLGLCVFYQSHGAWGSFVASMVLNQSGAVAKTYAHGQITALPSVFLRDRSAPFLILLGIVLLLHAWKNRNAPAMKIFLFALAAGVGIPITLHFSGVFPIYYGWMAALPVTLALCHGLSRQPIGSFWLKSLAVILLAGAIGIGFPTRFTMAALYLKGTSYPAMEQFVSGQLNAADIAYIDFTAFYPARRSAGNIFTRRYLEYAMTADEKKSVTALVIAPHDLPSITNAIPGRWQLVAAFHEDVPATNPPAFSTRKKRAAFAPYELAVYRRGLENLPQASQ